MRAHDELQRLLIGLQRPHAALRRAPQGDAVAARLHVDAEDAPRSPGKVGADAVVDLLLGHEHGELPLQRQQLIVAEEVARAQPGAVDDQRLAQRHELARLGELADLDAPAEVDEVVNQSIQVDGRLDAQLVAADRVAGGKGMLPGFQRDLAGAQVGGKQRLFIVLGIVPCGARGRVAETVAVDPGDAESPPRQLLELAVGDLRGLAELAVPGRCPEVAVDQPRGGGEARQRHVRGRVRRHRHGVDGHCESAPLQLARGGEAHGAATDDRRPAAVVAEGHLGRHPARAPGERHAGAAVAVVVDHRGVVEPVGAQQEAGGAVRPQPDRGADDTVPFGAHGREPQRRSPRRGDRPRRAAAQAGAREAHGAHLEERSSVHLRLRARSCPRHGIFADAHLGSSIQDGQLHSVGGAPVAAPRRGSTRRCRTSDARWRWRVRRLRHHVESGIRKRRDSARQNRGRVDSWGLPRLRGHHGLPAAGRCAGCTVELGGGRTLWLNGNVS